MTAHELLIEITRYDARLVRTADGGLKVQAPAPLPDDLMVRLRASKNELLLLVDGKPKQADAVQAQAGERTASNRDSNSDRAGRTSYTHYGAGHPDATPPEPMRAAAVAWPTDLSVLLRRVATAFEWTSADRQAFIAWARRDQQGIEDARQFLETEAAKLPVPGLSDRRREVLDRLQADPSIRYAWICEDRDEDPVRLVIAIRGQGTCELAIPREKFKPLELPQLIARLAAAQDGAP